MAWNNSLPVNVVCTLEAVEIVTDKKEHKCNK